MEKVNKRIWRGVVKRKSGAMTVVVEVQREWQRKPYDKKVRRLKRYMVHDPKDSAVIGSEVRFVECRPISKRKRWVIVSEK